MGASECEHNLLVPNQVHGDHIVAVTSSGADDLEDIREQIAEGCDAIICTAHGVPVPRRARRFAMPLAAT